MAHQVFELVVYFLLLHLSLLAVDDELFEFLAVLLLVFDVGLSSLDRVNCIEVHSRLLQLEFLVLQGFFPQGERLGNRSST